MEKRKKQIKKINYEEEYFKKSIEKIKKEDEENLNRLIEAKKQKKDFNKWTIIDIFIALFVLSILKLFFTFSGIFFNFIVYSLIFIVINSATRLFITGNEEVHQRQTEMILTLVTLLLSASQIYLLINQNTILDVQTTIQKQQTEIIKQTSQSNYPDVILASSNGIQWSDIKTITYPSTNQIAVGVLNIGKATAPSVQIHIQDDTFIERNINHKDDLYYFDISELKSGGFNATFFIYYLNPSKENNFSIGEKNITFKVTCPVCREPVSYQNVSVCITNSTSLSVCGEKWVKP